MTLPGIVTGSGQLRWLLILLVFVFGSPSIAVEKIPATGCHHCPDAGKSVAGGSQYLHPDADKSYASSTAG